MTAFFHSLLKSKKQIIDFDTDPCRSASRTFVARNCHSSPSLKLNLLWSIGSCCYFVDFLTNRATRRWLLKGFYSYTRVRVVETRLKNIRQGFHFFFNPQSCHSSDSFPVTQSLGVTTGSRGVLFDRISS